VVFIYFVTIQMVLMACCKSAKTISNFLSDVKSSPLFSSGAKSSPTLSPVQTEAHTSNKSGRSAISVRPNTNIKIFYHQHSIWILISIKVLPLLRRVMSRQAAKARSRSLLRQCTFYERDAYLYLFPTRHQQ